MGKALGMGALNSKELMSLFPSEASYFSKNVCFKMRKPDSLRDAGASMDLSLMPSVKEDCMKRHHSVLMDEIYSFSGKSDHASFASDTTTHFPDAVHRSASNTRYRTNSLIHNFRTSRRRSLLR
jgi:hypothetical protein